MNKSPLEELIEKYIIYSIEYTFIHKLKNDVMKNRGHLRFYTCHVDREKIVQKSLFNVIKKKIIFD